MFVFRRSKYTQLFSESLSPTEVSFLNEKKIKLGKLVNSFSKWPLTVGLQTFTKL